MTLGDELLGMRVCPMVVDGRVIRPDAASNKRGVHGVMRGLGPAMRPFRQDTCGFPDPAEAGIGRPRQDEMPFDVVGANAEGIHARGRRPRK